MGSKQKIVPVNAPREFGIHELFFSTTNAKGIIVRGNRVFARVSNYRFEEMVGKPHNLIRHPDMPRAVFKLLWDYLLAGKPVLAYVKNMASDGRYYWVVALAGPIADGYLSVRFKPSSQLFALIPDLYRELRAIELAHEENGEGTKAGMLAAGARLGEILREKGFADYDAFMQAALYQELNSRDSILAREHLNLFPPLPARSGDEDELTTALRSEYQEAQQMHHRIVEVYGKLDEYVRSNENLRVEAQAIVSSTREFQLICLNLSVASSRLASAGHTLTVIAAHLREASSWIGTIVSGLADQAAKISRSLGQIVFGLAWARVQYEMVVLYCHEFLTALADRDNAVQPSVYVGGLAALREGFCRTMKSVDGSLKDLSEQLKGLSIELEELRKAMMSLQVTYVGGLVEAARLTEHGVFGTIFGDIQKHMHNTNMKLETVSKALGTLETLARQTSTIIALACGAVQAMARNQDRLTALVGCAPASSTGAERPSADGRTKGQPETGSPTLRPAPSVDPEPAIEVVRA